MYPANQAALSSSAVPVLPTAGRPLPGRQAGAALDDGAEEGGGGVGGLAGDGLFGLPVGQLDLGAVLGDLVDEGVRAVLTVVGERRVRLGEVQDAGGGGAERDGGGVEVGVFFGMPRATAVSRTFSGPTSWAICA